MHSICVKQATDHTVWKMGSGGVRPPATNAQTSEGPHIKAGGTLGEIAQDMGDNVKGIVFTTMTNLISYVLKDITNNQSSLHKAVCNSFTPNTHHSGNCTTCVPSKSIRYLHKAYA